jgi:hypothetical protein
MKWLWALAILLTVKALATSCHTVEDEKFGNLDIEILAPDAKPDRDARVQLFTASGRSIPLVGRKATRIPYGSYAIQISPPGTRTVSKTLTVAQPEVHFRYVSPYLRFPCDVPKTGISGKVERNGLSDELWVKAIPARGLNVTESKVGPYGYFQVSGLDEGSTVLLVLRGDEVLATTTVRDFEKPVTIALRR